MNFGKCLIGGFAVCLLLALFGSSAEAGLIEQYKAGHLYLGYTLGETDWDDSSQSSTTSNRILLGKELGEYVSVEFAYMDRGTGDSDGLMGSLMPRYEIIDRLTAHLAAGWQVSGDDGFVYGAGLTWEAPWSLGVRAEWTHVDSESDTAWLGLILDLDRMLER